MTNPLIKLRTELGINRRQLALALGISYTRVQAMESGAVRSIGTIGGQLRQLGQDPEAVQKALTTWLNQEAETVLNKVKGPELRTQGQSGSL